MTTIYVYVIIIIIIIIVSTTDAAFDLHSESRMLKQINVKCGDTVGTHNNHCRGGAWFFETPNLGYNLFNEIITNLKGK